MAKPSSRLLSLLSFLDSFVSFSGQNLESLRSGLNALWQIGRGSKGLGMVICRSIYCRPVKSKIKVSFNKKNLYKSINKVLVYLLTILTLCQFYQPDFINSGKNCQTCRMFSQVFIYESSLTSIIKVSNFYNDQFF